MIGKYARGFRHLKRIVGSSKTKKIFILQNGRILECEAFVCNPKGHLVLFQSMGGDSDLYKIPSEYKSLAESLLVKYRKYYIVKDSRALFQFGRKYFVVDDDFDSQYESFQKNNKKLLCQVYGKFCYPNDPISCFMFGLIGNSPNLYVWALTNFFKNNVTLYTIEHIINFNNKYNQLVKKLSKGTITAYNSRDKVNTLINEIVQLRSIKRANDSINSFNTTQKKLLKSIDLNEHNVHILNRFGRLSGVKRRNFIRKMSTIENIDDIMHQMSLLSNVHFEWNRESLLDFIQNSENIKCDIVLDENNIVLVKVYTYDTIKLLAKTTNWCISKNKRYWNDYVEYRQHSTQFVMFDFNKPEDHELSIIGFTSMKNNGITNAHSYSNADLMGRGTNGRMTQLSSFLVSNRNNIYSIIKGNKIPLGKIMDEKKIKYEWNYRSFLSFLNYCINEEDYVIHYMDEEDNKIAFSTKHENLKYIINNKSFISNISLGHASETFVFIDFNYSKDDSESIRYAFVYNNESIKEEYTSEIFDTFGCASDISFDELLEYFNLPYDIICRTNDKVKRFGSAFRNHSINLLRQLITDKEIIETIKTDKHNTFYQSSGYALYDTIFNYHSFDYINLIYDNGYKISDFVNNTNLNDVAVSLLYEIGNSFRFFGRIPSEEDIKRFDENCFDNRQRLFIGLFKILDLILKNENNSALNKKISEVFVSANHNTELDKYMLKHILPTLSFKKLDDVTKYYLRMIISFNLKEFNDILISKKITKEIGTFMLYSMSSNHGLYEMFNKQYGMKKEKKNENTEKEQEITIGTWAFNYSSSF